MALLSAGRSSVTPGVFRPDPHRTVNIIMAEIPRLTRTDQLATPRTRHRARRDNRRPIPTKPLMLRAIATILRRRTILPCLTRPRPQPLISRSTGVAVPMPRGSRETTAIAATEPHRGVRRTPRSEAASRHRRGRRPATGSPNADARRHASRHRRRGSFDHIQDTASQGQPPSSAAVISTCPGICPASSVPRASRSVP